MVINVSYNIETEALLDGRNFASLATVGPDGEPQSTVVWFVRDGDDLLFSAIATRRKVLNIEADPRVSATIFDLGNPYSSVELRGTAVVLPDPEKVLPGQLSQRYLGQDPLTEPDEIHRVTIRMKVAKVNYFSP
jgi:PPOX class probable F420-dependent enzyme